MITKERLEKLKSVFERKRTEGKEVSKDPSTNQWGLGNVCAWDDAIELLEEVIGEDG